MYLCLLLIIISFHFFNVCIINLSFTLKEYTKQYTIGQDMRREIAYRRS